MKRRVKVREVACGFNTRTDLGFWGVWNETRLEWMYGVMFCLVIAWAYAVSERHHGGGVMVFVGGQVLMALPRILR